MDYFNERFGRYDVRQQSEIPDYMPKDGLLYYDSLVKSRPSAPTGQVYRTRTPGDGEAANDRLDFRTVRGKRCLYKSGRNNGLEFDLYPEDGEHDTGSGDYTWGCWVCDVLGTCTGQRVFSLWNEDRSETNYLNFSDSNKKLVIVHHSVTEGKNIATSAYEKGEIVGEWRLIYGWHGSGWFGPRMPPLEDGVNLNSHLDTRIVPAIGVLLQWPQCYGVAVRGAFAYNRVITAAEGMAIYNGSKDEQ